VTLLLCHRRISRQLPTWALIGLTLFPIANTASAATYNLTPTGGNNSTSTGSLTLSALMADLSAVVIVGDLQFSGFEYSKLGEMLDASGVSMLGYRDAAGNWGARFQGSFFAASGGVLSVGELNYGVSLQPSLSSTGWRISDARLVMSGHAVGDSSSLAVSQTFVERGELLTVQATKLDSSPAQIISFAQAVLDPPPAALTTSTEVFLSAGELAGSFASLANFSQTFARQQVGNLDPLPGDFNDDLVVDAEDLATWNGAFAVDGGGDANGDLQTDGSDFLYWQRYLGTSTPGVLAIPEPAALGASLMALVGMISLRLAANRRAH
jgi:hypothetical protein